MSVDALFRQAGVIRTDRLDEMLDVATLLARQPLPAGGRVAIVSNVGGPAVMCADACDAHGLAVPALSDYTREQLRQVLPPAASTVNPIDMLAEATAEQYLNTLRIVAEDPSVDSVISIFLPPLRTRCTDVAAVIREVKTDKPVLCVFMSSREQPPPTNDGLAVYSMPEPAVI